MEAERTVRAAAALLLALSLAGIARPRPAAAEQIRRQWWITAKDASNVSLRVLYERRDGESTRIDQSSRAVAFAALHGLTPADVTASPGAQRRFELAEDPGRLVFQGFVGNGAGTGDYDIIPDPAFQRQLARRGMRAATEAELTELALHHFKTATLDELASAGLDRFTPADLVTMVDHGIALEFVRAFKGTNLQPKTMRALAVLRDHGVRPELVQALTGSGFRPLTDTDIATLADHGVRPSLLVALARSASYRGMSAADIAMLADHGVSGEYIAELDRVAYHPPAADLVRLRDHGVTATFIQRLRSHGYGEMSVSDIIKLYEHGV